MKALSVLMVAIVAALHFGFLVLEMFFWADPIGLKIFGSTPEFASQSAVLAANQGLYNGIIAMGLVVGLMAKSRVMIVYLLLAIIVAGAYGAWSVKFSIFLIQSVPAIIALLLVAVSTTAPQNEKGPTASSGA